MKDLLTILGLCVLFAIFAFIAMIHAKYPGTRLSPAHYVPTAQNKVETQDNIFIPNYDNTGVFSCGLSNFTLHIPTQRLQMTALLPGAGDTFTGQGFEWVALLQDPKTWLRMFCVSTDKFSQLPPEPTESEFQVIWEKFGLSDYVIVEDQTKKDDSHGLYDYNLILKRNPELLSHPDNAQYVFMKSKHGVDISRDRFSAVTLIFYVYDYTVETRTRIDTIFNTLEIHE